MSQARCLLFREPGVVELIEFSRPSPKLDEVLIETIYSCISPGTELRILAGKQDGLPHAPFPVIPGYAIVGRVRDKGAAVPADWLNKIVLCPGTRRADHALTWGGHVSHAVARASDVVAVPESVEPRDAVLAHLAAISFRGVRMAQPEKGDTVAVLGLGPLGQFSARLCALLGAEVIAGGTRDPQVRLAKAAGVRSVQVERDNVGALKKLFPRGARIVVDATGNPGALRHAIELAAEKSWDDPAVGGARIVIQGSYGEPLTVAHHAAFAKELTFFWPRFSHRDDVANVLALIESGALRVNDVLTEIARPEDAAAVYARLKNDRGELLTAAFNWSAKENSGQARTTNEQSAHTNLRGRVASFFRRG